MASVRTFLALTLFVIGVAASAASNNAVCIFDACRALGRGINLGGMLEVPPDEHWGVAPCAEDLAQIARAGFSSVRVPVCWAEHALETPPYTISSAQFARVDTVLQSAFQHGLRVVVNLHHYRGLTSAPFTHTNRFIALWAQLAEHYAHWPAQLYFELLNEPHSALTAPIWNTLVQDTLKVIRRTNPTRPVVVGPVSWNSIDALDALQVPPDDPYLIVTVHYYNPMQFTHQGATWIPGMADVRGIDWAGSTTDVALVRTELAKAAAWARTHQRPLYLGEFGVNSTADMAARARWLACVARAAEELGMSWACWQYIGAFGIFDREVRRWHQPLLQALLPPVRSNAPPLPPAGTQATQAEVY